MAYQPYYQNTTEVSEEQKFNMGLAELERIHQKFCAYDSFMMRKKLTVAFEILCLIYDDIDFCLTEKESELIKIKEDKIRNLIKSRGNIDGLYQGVDNSGRVTIFFLYPKEVSELSVFLREYHKGIRKLMKKHGLLMPEKEESSLF